MTFVFNATRAEAASTLGISPETIKKWEKTGKIPPHVYKKFGYKTLRYCLSLLADWQHNQDDPDAQIRSIEALQNSLPSNHPQKRGRKAA
jgi:DNA-binding transcriptional MerR regulator